MSLYKNIIPIVAACTLLQACTIRHLSETQAAQYKHIGVISGIGDDFMISKTGTTVFGNNYQTEKTDVGADALLAAAVIASLSNKYDFTDLSRYDKEFADAMKTSTTSARKSAGDVVMRLVPPASYDAYIVIAPSLGRVAGTYESVRGVGINKKEFMIDEDACFLHAAYEVIFIDGKDYSVVANMVAFPLKKDTGFGVTDRPPVSAPAVKVDCKLWQKPDQSVPAIKQLLRGLITQAVPETLKDAEILR